MTISSPTYDPTTMATSLAQKYTASAQTQLTNRTNAANATAKGLTDLGTAINAFQTSLSSLTGLGQSIVGQSAVFSDTTIGTATAGAKATSGSYSFFVEQIAQPSRISYDNIPNATASDGGSIDINIGGVKAFSVAMAPASTDGDGIVTPRELAAAINNASDNKGRVIASVITVGNNVQQLVLASRDTGLANTVSLDASALPNGSSLKAALDPAQAKTLTTASDAIIWLGAQNTGTKIQQASNTFTGIDGVNITFAKASTVDPVTLTVGTSPSMTLTNVQNFVDTFNKLKKAIDGMLDAGDPSKNKAAGVFASDSGVESLRSRLIGALRPVGATSLATYGITAQRDGTLSVDNTRLTKALAANPKGLDTLFGSTAASGKSGIAGALDDYLDKWSDLTTGQLQQRQKAADRLQTTLASRQTDLDNQYNAAYARYLDQFTKLQALQSQMTNNSSLFDALFSSDKSN